MLLLPIWGQTVVAIINALGWPHMVFLFAVVFLAVFYKQLAKLISRITSIDKTGIKTSSTPEAQREKEKTEAVQELLLAIGDSIVLREVEGHIKSELNERKLDTEGDTVKVLIKHLAAAQILLGFEQIYNLIFGSQIFLLKKLNEVIGQGQKKEYMLGHFEHVKEIFKMQLSNWTFEQYMSFLFSRSLITLDKDEYHITNLGVEFLTWMVRNGRSEDKPL